MRDLPIDKTDILTLSGRDSKGHKVIPVFDSVPVWTGSDDTIATVAPTPDGSGALVTPVALGQVKVGVTAVIGGNTLTASLDVTVTPGAIVSLEIDETINP